MAGTRARATSRGRGPTRTVGSLVILVNGALAAYIAAAAASCSCSCPTTSRRGRSIGRALAAGSQRWRAGRRRRGGLLVAEINGMPAAEHPLAPFLVDAGFNPSAMGFRCGVAAGWPVESHAGLTLTQAEPDA